MADAGRLAAAFALLLGIAGCHTGQRAAAVGQPAPAWAAPSTTGETVSSETLRGRPYYLNVFASWCPPCQAEAPTIADLERKYRGRGLTVIGVDELETAATAERFRRRFGLSFPVIVDGGDLQAKYGVDGLPVHVFVDGSGTLRTLRVGEMSRAQIESAIAGIL